MAIIPITDEKMWHGIRKKHIGASEICALFGCGSSFTPTLNQLYFQKRGLYYDGDAGALAEFGKVMEPIVAHMAAAENHWDVRQCKEYHEHPEYPWLGCSVDYYIDHSENGPGLAQIKYVQGFAPGWTKSRAPDHVEYQVQQEMLVTNAARIAEGREPFAWNAIVSMHNGNPEDIRVMHRVPKPNVHKAIIDRSKRFMDDVTAGNEPALEGAKEYGHLVDMFKAAETVEELLDLRGRADLDDLLAQYQMAHFDENEAKMKKETIKSKLIRHCLKIEGDEISAHLAARTDNYSFGFRKGQSFHKAKPAKVVDTVTFFQKIVQ